MSRKKGKVVDTWTYSNNGQHLKVPVRVVAKNDGLWYVVDIDEPIIYQKHRDAAELKTIVWKELDRVLTISWREVYVITVETTNGAVYGHQYGDEHEVKFEYEHCEVGTCQNGEFVHRHPPNKSFPNHPRDVTRGLPGRGDKCSMVDATPANKAKIKAVVAAMKQLGKMMKDLMSPEKAQATLDNVKMLGLPAPKKESAS